MHIHIVSDDFSTEGLKTKKHANSFHPKLGFFIHLDDVISWYEPDVDPTWFAMVRPLVCLPVPREDGAADVQSRKRSSTGSSMRGC